MCALILFDIRRQFVDILSANQECRLLSLSAGEKAFQKSYGLNADAFSSAFLASPPPLSFNISFDLGYAAKSILVLPITEKKILRTN